MYEKLSVRALKNMYMATGFATLIYIIIAIVLEAAVFIPEKITVGSVTVAIISLLVLANFILSPLFRYHRYKYKIDNDCIDIIEGYLFVKRNIVPIERLHKLQILRGPFDKICKVAKVIVTTAGGDVTIRFLDVEKAEAITENLKVKINDIVMEQKKTEDKLKEQ